MKWFEMLSFKDKKTRFVSYALIILTIVILAAWNYLDSMRLFKYEGPYTEVKGIVSGTKYIGKMEIYGPYRVEVKLENNETFIVVTEGHAAQIDKGDYISLQIPLSKIFTQHGKRTTNQYQIIKAAIQ